MGKTAATLLLSKISGGLPPKNELIEVMTISRDNSAASADQIKLNFSPTGAKTTAKPRYPWLIQKK